MRRLRLPRLSPALMRPLGDYLSLLGRDRAVAGPGAARRVVGAIRTAYLAALLLTGFLATGSAILALDIVRERERREDIAEVAAFQRALAHRIALLAGAVTSPVFEIDGPQAQAELRDSIARMGTAHDRLTRTPPGARRPAPAFDTPALQRHYFEGPDSTDAAVRGFLEDAAWVAADPRRAGALATAWDLRARVTGPLLETLHQAVRLHEVAADEVAARSLQAIRLQLLLLLALLVAQGLLLFRPLLAGIGALTDRLEREATTDALTGMLNRRAFLAEVQAVRDRTGPGRSVLMVCDIPRLRDINESAGQAAGDLVLSTVAARLRAAATQGMAPRRGGPVLGRLAGDEFGLLLPAPGARDGEPAAAAIAARVDRILDAATEEPLAIGQRQVPVRLRAGAAVVTALDPLEALRAADLALRDAKRLGGGTGGGAARVRVFDPARDARRLAISQAVLEALAAAGGPQGIHAELQPQLDATDSRIVGFEALARWDHPKLGRLSPGEFLPLATEAGHLPQVGRMVRRSALHALAALRREGLPAPRVAVNLSAGELAMPDIVTRVEEDLREAGLAPRDLEIEITEEVVADGIGPATRAQLEALQAQGAALALDDFGTGAASLSQLLRLPVQVIKIDRSFIAGVACDPRREELVMATIRFAHMLGAHVVAEGVEEEAQLRVLRRLGCDVVQGYLSAPPMAPEALRAWLGAHAAAGPGPAPAIEPPLG